MKKVVLYFAMEFCVLLCTVRGYMLNTKYSIHHNTQVNIEQILKCYISVLLRTFCCILSKSTTCMCKYIVCILECCLVSK